MPETPTLEIDGCLVAFGAEGFRCLDVYLTENQKKISKIIVLCDENSHELCLPALAENVPSLAGYEILEIPSGEDNKNLDTCRQIWQALAELHADRRTLLINLGGGVVCDMGGFAASCYMRGIPFINVPTTLLSQVDASVGGKTGIDLDGLKNLVGLFSLPALVVVSPVFLSTLPQREVLSGFAEMIKHGLIRSRAHWDELSSSADFSPEKIGRLVYDSVKIKYDVVLEDPKEQGLRKILNFGHTIGHAVETYFLGTDTPVSHGHAVAIGMACETWLSTQLCGLDEAFTRDFRRYVRELYGDIDIPAGVFSEILAFMRHDKKNTAHGINFTLLQGVGHATTDHYASEQLICRAMEFYNQGNTGSGCGH